MANVVQLGNLENLISYLPEGVIEAVTALIHWIPPGVRVADDMNLFSSVTMTNTSTAVSANPGTVFLVVAQSRGTAGIVNIYNSASATVGTAASIAVPVTGTSGEATTMLLAGNPNNVFTTAISASAATTSNGSSAMANLPLVYIVYR